MSGCPVHRIPGILRGLRQYRIDGLITRVSPRVNSIKTISDKPIEDIVADFVKSIEVTPELLLSTQRFRLKNLSNGGKADSIFELSMLGFQLYLYCLRASGLTIEFDGTYVIIPSKWLYNDAEKLYYGMQAFDSVFCSSDLSKVDSSMDKKGLLPSFIRLASMPDYVQRILTERRTIPQEILLYLRRILYFLKTGEYIDSVELGFLRGIDLTQANPSGKYAPCPAIADGTIARIYHILLPLYQKAQNS